MKLDQIAGSGNDEYYTPEYAITPILKYLKPNSVIWCPFDTGQSNYVKILEAAGHKVHFSHISFQDFGFAGDFFNIEVPKCDYIISNPPYSKKNEVLTRLYELGIPFAMLFGVVGIFESQLRFNLFKNNPVEVMYFNKRISYFRGDEKFFNPPFSSVYVCSKVLPQQLVFEVVDK